MQETGYSTALLSPLGTYDDANPVCRGFTGSPCAYQNTKNFGLTFHAVLGDGGPQIRLESVPPRSGPHGVIWRRSFGVK